MSGASHNKSGRNNKNIMAVAMNNGYNRGTFLKKKCSDDLKSFNTSVIKYRSDVSSSNSHESSEESLESNSSYIEPNKIPLNLMPPLLHKSSLNLAAHNNNNNNNKFMYNNDKYQQLDGGKRNNSKHSSSSPMKNNNVQFISRPNSTLVTNKFSNSSPCVFYPSATAFSSTNISNNNNNGHFKSRFQGNHKNCDRRKTNGCTTPYGGGLDINRRVYGLMERFTTRSKMFFIPTDPAGLTNGNEFDALNRSIWDVYTWSAQTRETYLNKLEFWKIIYLSIQKVMVRYGLYLVGSTMSGLGLETSDIDMCLLVRPSMADPRSDALGQLQSICELLERCDFVKSPEVIMAKVPILKFRDAHSRFEVDLNCNNAVGIRNTHLLNAYANLDWRVRPLVLLVKVWAQANDINDAKRMTINSYSLTLMMIHFLQSGVSPPAVPCLQMLYPERFGNHVEIQSLDTQDELPPFHSDNKQSLGELFLGFLHYYTSFNYTQFAISVRQGSVIYKEDCRHARSPKNDATQWKLLCVEEPFELTNTARCVYDVATFDHIKSVFRMSYETLMHTKNLASILGPAAGLVNGNNYQ